MKILCIVLILIIVVSYIIFFLRERASKYFVTENQSRKIITMMERVICNAIESKDICSSGSSRRIAEYSMEIARRLGKSKRTQVRMYYAGLLHDIGKIRLSEKILRKNGKLSAVEIECLRFHTIMSSNMVRGISEVEDAAKYHHERYDGKGYPEGLKGREIPESARIVAVADAYDAMSSSRRFRDHFPQEFIRSEIESECGYQFDPKIAKIMLQIIDDENFFVKHPVIYEKQILYVDDDSIAQKVMEFMLKDERNYNLTSVNSASQCLEIMEQEKFDIVILDITLGEMDGFALLDKIRKNSDVPVIFVSSDKTKESVSRAKGRGVEYYLVKPFSHQELVESIEDILRKDLCE